MNVAEATIDYLEKIGVQHIFLLSGGGIMYLLEAIGRSKIKYVCNYHEQACAIASEGYARIKGFSVCCVTFGPGAMNAVSGIVGAWHESIPTLVLAGQVRSDLIANYDVLRQVGPQEGNLIDVVKPITKYAVSIKDPSVAIYELSKAIYIAKSGRPGPVFIEFPIDIQAKEIPNNKRLNFYIPPKPAPSNVDNFLDILLKEVNKAKCPIIILGNGVKISHTEMDALKLSKILNIPVITPHTSKDVYDNFNELYFGIFGTCGQRAANIVLQNSDLIIAFGVGFNVSKTGFNTSTFAHKAKKIIIDIDLNQIIEMPIRADHYCVADLKHFFPRLIAYIKNSNIRGHKPWLELCKSWKTKYDEIDSEFGSSHSVNPYFLMKLLSEKTKTTDSIVTGNGLDSVAYCQGFRVKHKQKTVVNGNWGSMGWDLPLAIGVHFATSERVICITGDGSIMQNIQELLTIGKNLLPVKIFLINNNGYGSIRATQDNYFSSHYVGADSSSGVFNPNFASIAEGFFLKYRKINNDIELLNQIDSILKNNNAELIELVVSSSQWIKLKASSFRDSSGKLHSKELDDMSPFLPEDEIEMNRRLAREVE